MAERTKIWIADKMKELMKTKPLNSKSIKPYKLTHPIVLWYNAMG